MMCDVRCDVDVDVDVVKCALRVCAMRCDRWVSLCCLLFVVVHFKSSCNVSLLTNCFVCVFCCLYHIQS